MPRTSTRPQLRHRVRLVAKANTTNSLGENLAGFNPDAGAEVWADVAPLSASESYRAQRLGQDTSHKITIRWLASPPAVNDRLYWVTRSRWMKVNTVRDPDMRREWLEIMVTDEGEAAPASPPPPPPP